MSVLHILQGGIENGDKARLEKAARRNLKSPTWVVPKSVNIGDPVVIYIAGHGFVATARVNSAPHPREDWPNRYGAGLTSIRLIEPAISLATIRRRLPQLTWANYPRSITTPPPDIAEQIRNLIKQRHKADSEGEQAVLQAQERAQAKGQGFLLNKRLRLRLEQYAMAAAQRYFESLGFTCEDHSKSRPYDFRCTRSEEVVYIEAKGTQTDGDGIVLTRGEVEFARTHKQRMGLFVLHRIRVSAERGDFSLTGGERRLIIPWDVDQGCLRPVSFMYQVPAPT